MKSESVYQFNGIKLYWCDCRRACYCFFYCCQAVCLIHVLLTSWIIPDHILKIIRFLKSVEEQLFEPSTCVSCKNLTHFLTDEHIKSVSSLATQFHYNWSQTDLFWWFFTTIISFLCLQSLVFKKNSKFKFIFNVWKKEQRIEFNHLTFENQNISLMFNFPIFIRWCVSSFEFNG